MRMKSVLRLCTGKGNRLYLNINIATILYFMCIFTYLFDCEMSLLCVAGYLFEHWHRDWKQKSAEKALD